MDQLKEQLVKIKPYAFWIACSAILLGSLATWYMSTGTLHEQFTQKKSDVISKFAALRGIEPKLAKHPNQATNEEMAKMTRAFGEEVARGWDLQYKRQEGVLVWPALFDQNFHNEVKDLRPIEKVPVNTPLHLTIADSFRRQYRDFIADELPGLATTIGGRWYVDQDPNATENFAAPRIGQDGQPIVDADRSMVLWSPENQKEILTMHFGFTAEEDDPNTLEVLYAQEDLWVLQNLMSIIKRTNEGSEGRHDAAVKRIEFIRIGRLALGNAGQVMIVGPGTSAGGIPGGAGGPGGEGLGGANQPAQPAEGTQQPTQEAPPVSPTADPGFQPQDPGNWRYVDQKNVPLAGFQLRAALTPPADPAAETGQNVLLTVAKRMPVRLRFEIDQRRLNKLLAEFGNAPLPVEIRQIRINRDPAPPGSIDGFFSAGGGGAGQGGEGLGPGPGSGMAMPSPRGEGGFGPGAPARYNEGGIMGAGNLTRDATVDTNLIQLELYGIVYLYNPVNRGLLGLEPAGATAMTTPPAATPTVGSGG